MTDSHRVDRMRTLVIKCTAGAEEPERCNQAFTVAAAGVAAGAQVSLWLTGEAAWFGVPGRAEEFELDLATPLAELRDIVLDGRHADGLQPVRRRAAASSRPTWSRAPASPAPPSSPRRSSPTASRPSSTDRYGCTERVGALDLAVEGRGQVAGLLELVGHVDVDARRRVERGRMNRMIT